MGLLDEIRLWNIIRQENLWNFWICLDCWKRYECESRYTTEFVTILNKCDCWKRSDNWLNLWQCWINRTVDIRWECKTRSDYLIFDTV